MKDLAKITSLEMPTFTNQMRVKCEFSFAEWASHLGSWGHLSPPLCGPPIIIMEDLIWRRN